MLGSTWAKGAADAGWPAVCAPACARKQHWEARGGDHSGSSSGPGRALPCPLPTECPSWEPVTRLPHPRGVCDHWAITLSPEMRETLRSSILLHVDDMALCFFLKGWPRRHVGVSGASGLWEPGLSALDGWLGTGTGGFPEQYQSLVHLWVRFTLLTPMALCIGTYQPRNSTKATFCKVTTSWRCLSYSETVVTHCWWRWQARCLWGQRALRLLLPTSALGTWFDSRILQYSIKGHIFKFSIGTVSHDVHCEIIHFSKTRKIYLTKDGIVKGGESILCNFNGYLEEFQTAWGNDPNIVLSGKDTMLHEQEPYS